MKVSRNEAVIKLAKITLYLVVAYLLFTRAAKAEVSFEKKTMKIGHQIVEVELADDFPKRAQGLMNRTELKDGKGMLFVFEETQPLSFWMKNTLIPLSIGFFDKDKKLFQTLDMKPASPMEVRPPSYVSSQPGLYALEVPQGWFKNHNVKLGSVFSYVENAKPNKTRP